MSGKYTSARVCEKYGITYNEKNCSSTSLSEWVAKYRAVGPEAFTHSYHNKSCSSELKTQAVEEYLSGKGTILEFTVKHGISVTKVFRRWILKYNADIELKSYDPKREVYMAETQRKTTLAECKEIVGYCIAHDRDYKGTASLYDVSYSQVYSWVKKYDAAGEDGLSDKRGHHKPDDEADELERLRRENLRLKRQIDNGPTEGLWGIIKSEMDCMYKITDEGSLRSAIDNYMKFYAEERPQERFHCQTQRLYRESTFQ